MGRKAKASLSQGEPSWQGETLASFEPKEFFVAYVAAALTARDSTLALVSGALAFCGFLKMSVARPGITLDHCI